MPSHHCGWPDAGAGRTLSRMFDLFVAHFTHCICSLEVPWQKKQSSGGLKQQESIFLMVLKAGSPTSGCWQGWFLLRSLSLACRQPPSRCFMCLSLCAQCATGVSHLIRTPALDSGPSIQTPLTLIIPFKSPISKYSHIL